jgi:ATP-dependent DNA ligase
MNGLFIRCPHPKTTTKLNDVPYYLNKGWLCQPKINGRRIQVHRMPDCLICYTRQGTLHTKTLDDKLTKELMAYMPIGSILEGEYIFQTGQVFLFDLIEQDGFLGKMPWLERFGILPDIQTDRLIKLPVLTDFKAIAELMNGSDKLIEGVVLKHPGGNRFDDDSIIRCRKT